MNVIYDETSCGSNRWAQMNALEYSGVGGELLLSETRMKGQDKTKASTVADNKKGRLAGWKEYKEQAEIIRPQWQMSLGREGNRGT